MMVGDGEDFNLKRWIANGELEKIGAKTAVMYIMTVL